MMKKMLTIATAALALSACGPDAPSVEDTSTSAQSTTTSPSIQGFALEGAWNNMDDSQQHDLCGMFVIDLDALMDAMDPDSMGLTRNQLIDFFAEKCF